MPNYDNLGLLALWLLSATHVLRLDYLYQRVKNFGPLGTA